MKNSFLLFFCILLILSVSGCGAEQNQLSAEDNAEGKLCIGISFATLQEERWAKERDYMEQQAEEMDITLRIASANADEQWQYTQVAQMLEEGIDALILIAQNSSAASEIVELAHIYNVPVIACDRLIRNCDLDFFVTYDCFSAGKMQAEYAVQAAPEGTYFLIGGSPDDNNAILLREGQMEILQPYIDSGKIRIAVNEWAEGWNPDSVADAIREGLDTWDDVACILTSDDALATSAITLLSERQLAGDVIVTGLDTDLAACQHIAEGTQAMTVYRCFYKQDRIALEAAAALANGNDPSSLFDVVSIHNGYADIPAVRLDSSEDMYIVTEDNLEDVISEGWQSREEVYYNIS